MSSVPKKSPSEPSGDRPTGDRPREQADSTPEPKKKMSPGRRAIVIAAIAAVLLVGAVFGVKTIIFHLHHATTDDAQVEGHIAPVLPKVSGYVTQVLVDDNQKVAAGQIVLTIDTRDLQSKVDTAQAAVENAKAGVAVARANVASAQTNRGKTSVDLSRYATLRRKEEVSQQQYDAARAEAEASASEAEAMSRSVAAAQAQVAQKQADLDYAKLQLSYATVAAPAAGIVSRKSVEVGQFVQMGQPLLAIVADEQPWVVANFKETQLKKMRVGQPVVVEVDAYPKVEFHGRVDSISAATGAKFALLPPDNATGNFTKVVQRVPVKIVLTDRPDPVRPLRTGMSVNAIVTLD